MMLEYFQVFNNFEALRNEALPIHTSWVMTSSIRVETHCCISLSVFSPIFYFKLCMIVVHGQDHTHNFLCDFGWYWMKINNLVVLSLNKKQQQQQKPWRMFLGLFQTVHSCCWTVSVFIAALEKLKLTFSQSVLVQLTSELFTVITFPRGHAEHCWWFGCVNEGDKWWFCACAKAKEDFWSGGRRS